jgi:hypothetical protein
MEGKQAKVLISVNEGRMEFEGSEEFVERQLTAYADLIRQSLRGAPPAPKKPGPNKTGQNETEKDQEDTTPVGLAGYEHLFAKSTGGKIQILKELPGSNTRKKMANAALLLALAHSLSGKSGTTFKEIREVCEAHGALDTGNFAKTIKDQKADFVFEGSGGSQSVTLTVPGRKAAEKIAADLNK